MDSKRVGAFRPAARVGVIGSAVAFLAMVLAPSPAFAATTLGTTGDLIDVVCSFPSQDSVQLSSADPLVSYLVPGAGTITQWNTQSLGLPGSVGLQVWRLFAPATPTALAQYQLVGSSPTVVPTGTALTLTNPITVQAGDMIGMRMEGVVACGHRTGALGDTWANAFGSIPPLPTLGTEGFQPPANSFRLNISATFNAAPPPPPPPPPPPTGCSSPDTSSSADSSNENDECDEADEGHDASSARTDEPKDSH